MKKTYILKLLLLTWGYLALSYNYGVVPIKAEPNILGSANNLTSFADAYILKLIQQGDVYYDQNDYITAIAIYNEALQKDSTQHSEKNITQAIISHNLGMSYLALKMYPQSAFYLHHALRIHQQILCSVPPTNKAFKEIMRKAVAKSHYNIGCLHLVMNKHQAAIQDFKAVLDMEVSDISTCLEVQLLGNNKFFSPTYQDIQVSQASQHLYSTVLAQQAAFSSAPPKKEKDLTPLSPPMGKIGAPQGGELPPLNMTTFPQLNVGLSHFLQAPKKPSPPKKVPLLQKQRPYQLLSTNTQIFSCLQCGKECRDKTALTIHTRVHTGEKPFTCSYCDKKFSQKQNMKVHIRVHTKEKPFACHFCDKKFSIKINRENHLRSHTGEKPFQCAYCDKKFSRKQQSQIHMRVHTGEKPFQCAYCDKKFSQQSNMKVHLRIHTGEKPFACTLCEKKFIEKKKLKQHMRVHTGEKPFACALCGKRFAQKQYIKVHMRVHTKEQPFKCPLCPKKFSIKANRQSHLRSHTGAKAFSCPHCDKKFVLKHNMKRHIKTHMGKTTTLCPVCGKKFSRKDYIKKHINRMHKDTIPHTALS